MIVRHNLFLFNVFQDGEIKLFIVFSDWVVFEFNPIAIIVVDDFGFFKFIDGFDGFRKADDGRIWHLRFYLNDDFIE